MEVIECEASRGRGLPDDPYRTVTQYWTLDGATLLAERDPYMEAKGESMEPSR
jgi:hypothetical protein